jgi:hypothetical protein
LEEYLKFPNARSLEVYIPRRDLNIVYLPIKVISESGVSAEWVLEHYDYARSRSLLRAVPGHRRDGPYIVSVLKPLSRTTTLSGQYLDQDLSAVPPHLVTAWVREFLNQAAQERFWEARTVQRFALRLRTTIAIAAVGLPEVKDGLDRWISWVR